MRQIASLLADPRFQTADMLRIPERGSARGASLKSLPLPAGYLHEWFLAGDLQAEEWHPPLTLLAQVAAQVKSDEAGRVVWLGRRCWPTFQLIAALFSAESPGAALKRSLFLDPLTDEERFWAIGQVLRCPGIAVVVADGSGMTAVVNRRLQLAAECGKAVGLIARPPWEIKEPTHAATRWQVSARATESESMQWDIELLRCRGRQPEQDAPRRWMARWSYGVFRGTGTFDLSADVGGGSAQTQAGEESIRAYQAAS